MATTKSPKTDKRPIEQYSHPGKNRVNNRPVSHLQMVVTSQECGVCYLMTPEAENS